MAEGEQPAPAEDPNDPYRFGKPERPIPPEYAPPGYVPDEPPEPAAPPPLPGPHPFYGSSPYATMPSPYGTPTGQHPQQYGGQQYGPPSYGQQQYGEQPAFPPYPAYGAPPPQPVHKSNGKATASLVLGIVSIPMFVFGIFDLVPIVLALVFGIQTLNMVKGGRSDARGKAIAGIVCAVVGAVAAVIFTVVAVRAVNKCGGIDQPRDDAFYSCVRDHIGG